MTTRPRRSDDLLDAVEPHLRYELGMFVAVAAELAPGNTHGDSVRNGLLESFVIHARALTDFFWPPGSAKVDDVIAADFFSDPGEWEVIRPAFSERLQAARTRAHKEVAHLTYARVNVPDETRAWDVEGVSADLKAAFDVFALRADRCKFRLNVDPEEGEP